jgi:hypothetical protein
MSLDKDKAFWEHIKERYKGKIYRIERTYDPALVNIVKVYVMFHVPVEEADELEMYRRINSVLKVIAEGDDG